VIRLAVLLRSRLPICGSRSIVVILEILNECFKGELFDCIPCNQVIEDWCEKAGLDMHTKVKDQFVDNEYITITDESISVGKQKLLLQLAAPADSIGKPLSHSDVSIVGMSVSPSWTGDSVKAEMEKASKSIGRRPLYSVSDNGYNLCNACRDAGIPHHRDISHTFGTIFAKIRKNNQSHVHNDVFSLFWRISPCATVLSFRLKATKKHIKTQWLMFDKQSFDVRQTIS
jgi:hypothetical protein